MQAGCSQRRQGIERDLALASSLMQRKQGAEAELGCGWARTWTWQQGRPRQEGEDAWRLRGKIAKAFRIAIELLEHEAAAKARRHAKEKEHLLRRASRRADGPVG